MASGRARCVRRGRIRAAPELADSNRLDLCWLRNSATELCLPGQERRARRASLTRMSLIVGSVAKDLARRSPRPPRRKVPTRIRSPEDHAVGLPGRRPCWPALERDADLEAQAPLDFQVFGFRISVSFNRAKRGPGSRTSNRAVAFVSPFGSSDLRSFDIAVSACSASAAVGHMNGSVFAENTLCVLCGLCARLVFSTPPRETCFLASS